MRVTALAAAIALAACAMPQEQAVRAGESEPAASAVPEAKPALEGRWQVDRIDGAPPVINIRGYAPVVTIGAQRIHFQSQCIYADWRYARSGGAFVTSPYFEAGSGMCARGLAPGETAVQAAFDKVERVSLGANDTLVVEGGGHRLELRRTALGSDGLIGIRHLAGAWRVAAIDGEPSAGNDSLALAGSERELWWEPRCAGMARSYRLTGATIAFSPRLGAPPPGAQPAPVCAIGLPPRLSEVFRALDAASNVERTGEDGVLFSGGGRSLLLIPQ